MDNVCVNDGVNVSLMFDGDGINVSINVSTHVDFFLFGSPTVFEKLPRFRGDFVDAGFLGQTWPWP